MDDTDTGRRDVSPDVKADSVSDELRNLKLQHDSATPDQISRTSSPPTPSTSQQDPDAFIFGAATRLGGRVLGPDGDPWTHNAWDNVTWDEEQERAAAEAIERQQLAPMTKEEQERLNATPEKFWNLFYKNVQDTFFKERSWLTQEFEALHEVCQPDAGPKRVCEIGCGTGATAYPLLASSNNPDLFIHALDFSREAIKCVKVNKAYDETRILAETWSLSDKNGLSEGVKPGSIDVAVLIFVFSALHPTEWDQALANILLMLKPGGVICFRDYGRNDLAQLRFKSSALMEPNLYARGDRTRVYFFTKDELHELFAGRAGCEQKQLGVDRRLLMNRKRRLKMYRMWMQGVWKKPGEATSTSADRKHDNAS